MNALDVTTPSGPAGTLAREAGRYQFTCAAAADVRSAVSLTMPVRRLAYTGATLPPIFQMNQPEGFLRERLRHLLAKSTADDPALTLALLPGDAAIGRVFLSREGTPPATTGADVGESLQHILRYPGAEGLFDTLLARYLLRSGVSGVQPKVLVPERAEPGAAETLATPAARATAVTHDLIVKSGLDEFPGLAINEFVCMTAVARAGVPCPPFYLSDNRRLFVMRRFDRTPAGAPLGFEDMAVLCGLDAERKYGASYERIARVVADNCAAPQVLASLHQLFDMVALSCILGNGDAHLKNFVVFCRTRTEVDELTESLNGRGYRAEALHGGLSQEQRDRVMKKFRANTADLLIATDVAARGLDVEHVSHVVNYDVPTSAEAYVHRIGRTGRAGRDGVAITLAEPREHRLLRNIEFLTKQKIQIAAVPTVADLRARRIEMTKASLRETIVAGELDHFRAVVDSLAQEFDIMDVAAAAVKMADSRDGAEAEEIPSVTIRPDRPERPPSRFEKVPAPRVGPAGAGAGDAPAGKGISKAGGKTFSKKRITPEWDVARLYIGAGRAANVRAGDLVGAIVNEAGVDARAIGAIQITDRFSLVEVPADIADSIIETLRATTIKGKRVPVRRDREQAWKS